MLLEGEIVMSTGVGIDIIVASHLEAVTQERLISVGRIGLVSCVERYIGGKTGGFRFERCFGGIFASAWCWGNRSILGWRAPQFGTSDSSAGDRGGSIARVRAIGTGEESERQTSC